MNSNLETKNIWIIGCGDIGCRVADLCQQKSDHAPTVNGIVRSTQSLNVCEQHNIQGLKIDLSEEYDLPLDQFQQSDVYYFAPPPSEGVNDPTLDKFLNLVGSRSRRIVLISTTGVYGDSKGEWIDENTPVNPTADRAKRRYSAEQLIQNWANKHETEYMILRVPGIYALDRLPLARLKKGLPVVQESEAGYTNRIHADDLAIIAKTAMQSQHKNQIYNATDGHPSTITDYFNQIADFSNLPRPPQISMQEAEQTLSAGMVSYLQESRRIRNDKMLNELNISLQYPNLKTFLRSCGLSL